MREIVSFRIIFIAILFHTRYAVKISRIEGEQWMNEQDKKNCQYDWLWGYPLTCVLKKYCIRTTLFQPNVCTIMFNKSAFIAKYTQTSIARNKVVFRRSAPYNTKCTSKNIKKPAITFQTKRFSGTSILFTSFSEMSFN